MPIKIPGVPDPLGDDEEIPHDPYTQRDISDQKLAELHQAVKESILKTAQDYYNFVHSPEKCSPVMHKRFERIESEGWPQKDRPDITYERVRKIFESLPPEKFKKQLAALADRFKFLPRNDHNKTVLEVYNDEHDDEHDGYTVNIPDSFKPLETKKKNMYFSNAVITLFNATMREAAEYKMYNEGIHVDRGIPEEIRGIMVIKTSYAFSDANDLVKFINALLPLGKEFPPINSPQLRY